MTVLSGEELKKAGICKHRLAIEFCEICQIEIVKLIAVSEK